VPVKAFRPTSYTSHLLFTLHLLHAHLDTVDVPSEDGDVLSQLLHPRGQFLRRCLLLQQVVLLTVPLLLLLIADNATYARFGITTWHHDAALVPRLHGDQRESRASPVDWHTEYTGATHHTQDTAYVHVTMRSLREFKSPTSVSPAFLATLRRKGYVFFAATKVAPTYQNRNWPHFANRSIRPPWCFSFSPKSHGSLLAGWLRGATRFQRLNAFRAK